MENIISLLLKKGFIKRKEFEYLLQIDEEIITVFIGDTDFEVVFTDWCDYTTVLKFVDTTEKLKKFLDLLN